MIVNNLGAVFEVSDGYFDFSVSKLGDDLFIYSDEWEQTFSYTGEMTKEELELAFPDRKAAVRAAKFHTKGTLNKEKFKNSASKLKEKDIINIEKYNQLVEFINSCNCAPGKATMKLINMGFGGIVGDLDFYEESPLLIETTQALIDFIKHM